MNRKTLLAGAVFVGLLLVTMAVLNAPEKGARTGESPRPVPPIAAGSIETIDVTKDGKTTTIKKEGTTYKVTAPTAYAADQEAAKAAFEALEKLEFSGIVTDQKSKHNDLEVGDKSVRVVAKKGTTVLADLHVGKVSNSVTMVRKGGDGAGKDEVWQAVGSLKFQFDKDNAGWRDKSIVTFAEADAEKIEVSGKGGKIALTRPPKGDAGAEQAWKVVDSSIKVEPFDKAVAGDLVSAMSALKANDFADGVSAADSGLDAPALTVTVGLKGDKKETVLIGKKKGEEDFYVKSEKSPQVFLVKKYSIDRINKRPIEFRDKTMCDVAEADITQVSVTRDKESYTLVKDAKKSGADAWKLAKPAGVTLDTTKVTGITSAFKELKATSFAEDNGAATTGLDKPTATVVATAKGKTCTLKVGKEGSDKQSSYVAAAGQPDVYVAPKWSLDRFLVKLDDLKKK